MNGDYCQLFFICHLDSTAGGSMSLVTIKLEITQPVRSLRDNELQYLITAVSGV